MLDSSDEEHRGPVGNLKELLNETTFVMGSQDREWTELSAEIRKRRYKWVKVCHRVLVQQDHILCEDPNAKSGTTKKRRQAPKELSDLLIFGQTKAELLFQRKTRTNKTYLKRKLRKHTSMED